MFSFSRFESGLLHIEFHMTNTTILRTRALKLFRAKLGNPIRSLNSVMVGLCGVGAGVALKPSDLAVSWNPSDLVQAEREARGFAIKSLMVTACDALDHYLMDLGSGPSPLADMILRSVLRKEPQTIQKGQVLTAQGISVLEKRLNEVVDRPSEIKLALREFLEKFCGKQKTPSLNARCSALSSYVQALSGSSVSEIPLRPSYHSAVTLLIAWRNVLVHDMDKDPLDPKVSLDLIADKEYMSANHAGIDFVQTLERYESKSEPSLKDISTLVSILMRYLAATDARLIAACNLSAYAQEAICEELKSSGVSDEILRKWAGKSFPERVSKALKLIGGHGFVPISFDKKKNSYAGRLLDVDDMDFLKVKKLKELKASIFQSVNDSI